MPSIKEFEINGSNIMSLNVEVLERRDSPAMLYYNLWAGAKMLGDPDGYRLAEQVSIVYNGEHAFGEVAGMGCHVENPENLVIVSF